MPYDMSGKTYANLLPILAKEPYSVQYLALFQGIVSLPHNTCGAKSGNEATEKSAVNDKRKTLMKEIYSLLAISSFAGSSLSGLKTGHNTRLEGGEGSLATRLT